MRHGGVPPKWSTLHHCIHFPPRPASGLVKAWNLASAMATARTAANTTDTLALPINPRSYIYTDSVTDSVTVSLPRGGNLASMRWRDFVSSATRVRRPCSMAATTANITTAQTPVSLQVGSMASQTWCGWSGIEGGGPCQRRPPPPPASPKPPPSSPRSGAPDQPAAPRKGMGS